MPGGWGWWLRPGPRRLLALALTLPPALALAADAAGRLLGGWPPLLSVPWAGGLCLLSGILALSPPAAAGPRRAWAGCLLSAAADRLPLLLPAAATALALAAWRTRAGPAGGVVLGRGPWGRPLALADTDRLLHLHVLGPTGSGKSSAVLLPLMAQDTARGRGFALIEPKGDLAAALRSRVTRSGRTLIYFDPREPDCPRFNPLAGPAEAAGEALAWALSALTPLGHPYYETAARVELLYSVRAVKAVHGEAADLTHLQAFLRHDPTRLQVLGRVRDPAVLGYFREQLGSLGPRKAAEQRQGLLNRLGLWLADPRVAAVLSGPGDFSWDQVLAEGTVVLAPLTLAGLGPAARALAALLWQSLAAAAYRRPPGAAPYFLYLDEFQQYVSPELGEFLALARGFGVGLVLAHQDLAQLAEPLRSSVLANARQRLALGGLAPEDIARLRALAAPFPLPDRLRYLPRGQAWASLTRGGRLRPPVPVRLRHLPL
ncbi:MAG: type IV secretory system conjugative DNA transfer family protein [Firmicutes bacterium]|nr:type IV secretory system conjugative DNA transfer family protein [Bacillota bacterium]